jgi:hypothetical protein
VATDGALEVQTMCESPAGPLPKVPIALRWSEVRARIDALLGETETPRRGLWTAADD